MEDVAIAGVGMTRFGRHESSSLKALANEAIDLALADAGIEQGDIEMAFVANSMASVVTGQVSIVGQTILRARDMSAIPVFNIDNACASSSSAVNLAQMAIGSGQAGNVLVVGVEKLYSSDRSRAYVALNGAADVEFVEETGIDQEKESVFVAAIYPERLAAYAQRWGLSADTLARISVKNRRHASQNPVAQYTEPLTVEQVLEARTVVEPVTTLMCAPIGDGASAAVLRRADRIDDERPTVHLRGSAIGMGTAAPAGAGSAISTVAARAYEQAGIGPAEIDVAEVHDSIAFNELLAYEELGFCEPGEGARMVADEATSLGGRIPVNPSGGLESRGHPVAATGLAQLIELTNQLRGEAGDRQVPDVHWALAENAGGFAGSDTAAIAITVLGT